MLHASSSEKGRWACLGTQYGTPFTPLGSPTVAGGLLAGATGYALASGAVCAGTLSGPVRSS